MKDKNYYAEYREKNRKYLNAYKKMWQRESRGSTLPVKYPKPKKRHKRRIKGFCYSCNNKLKTKREIFCDHCFSLFEKHKRT